MYIKNNILLSDDKKIAANGHLTPDGITSFQVDLEDVRNVLSTDFPEKVVLIVTLPSNLALSRLFEAVFILKENDKIIVDFSEWLDGMIWSHLKWSPGTFAEALVTQARQGRDVQVNIEKKNYDDDILVDGVSFCFSYDLSPPSSINVLLNKATSKMSAIIHETEIVLSGGVVWKKEYEHDEASFCIEVLTPLLKKMKFLSIRYMHGRKEYGKDFIFSEITKFETLRYYGLQAKAGDISGKVNSDVDQILGQLEDAFSMPFYELGVNEPRYISIFIIAISGHFSENAREKIVAKMPRGLIGSVYFLDKTKILELIDKYWDS